MIKGPQLFKNAKEEWLCVLGPLLIGAVIIVPMAYSPDYKHLCKYVLVIVVSYMAVVNTIKIRQRFKELEK
jgi:hypothetical protein